MKRLGVYIVVMVGCLFVGLTTYYMIKNYEVIDISADTIENQVFLNVGQTTSLNVVHELAQTELSYSFSEDGIISYNVETGEITGLAGGDVELTITSENTKYGDNGQFTFNVKVGDGSQAAPYYVLNKDDLKAIGGTRTYSNGNSRQWPSDAFYQLRNDIDLAGEEWVPLCGENGFSGSFVGGNSSINTISNLTISTNQPYAGLFAGLTGLAEVSYIAFDSPRIAGNFNAAGVVAGLAQDSKISKIDVKNGTVLATPYTVETRATAFVGGIIGATMGTIVANNMETALAQRGSIYMCSYQGVVGTNNNVDEVIGSFESEGMALMDIGGIVGYMFGSTIENNKAEVTFSINAAIAEKAAAFERVSSTGICIDVGGIVGATANNYVTTSGNLEATIYPIVKNNLAIVGIDNVPTTARGVIGHLPLSVHFSGTVEGTNQWVVGNYFYTTTTLILEGGSSVQNATTRIPDANALKSINTYVSMPGTPWEISGEEGSIDSPWILTGSSPVINYYYQDTTLPTDQEITEISTAEEFYKVYYNMTSADLSNIARKYYLAQNYKLTADIDLSSIEGLTAFAPIGSGMYAFNGAFDGNGYTISFEGVTILGDSFGGMFGQIGSNAEVKNLTVEGLTIDGVKYAGGVAGVNYGKITDCVVSLATINNATYAGGIVGINKGTITQTIVEAEEGEEQSVSPTSVSEIKVANLETTFSGGISGINYGTISNLTVETYIYGETTTEGDFARYIGGMVGYNYEEAKLENCYVSNGEIRDESTIALYMGGFAGINAGNITLCGFGGNANGGISPKITGSNDSGKQVAGGFAAMITSTGSVSKSFANVTINSRIIGGFAAYMIGDVSESYVTGMFTGNEVGGFAVHMALTSGSTEGGHIINSYTVASLTALNESSKLAGLSLYMRYPAVIEKCYMACSFNGDGEAYYESLTNTREGFVNWVTSWARPAEKLGTITNVVINEKGSATKTSAIISYEGQKVIYLQPSDVENPLNYSDAGFNTETIWQIGGSQDTTNTNPNKEPILVAVEGLHGIIQDYNNGSTTEEPGTGDETENPGDSQQPGTGDVTENPEQPGTEEPATGTEGSEETTTPETGNEAA